MMISRLSLLGLAGLRKATVQPRNTQQWATGLSTRRREPPLNPLVEDQRVYRDPVFHESEFIFSPSAADVEKAEKLFVPSKKHVIRYLQGVYRPSDVPAHKKAEIAFLGRSNVGKSSLIKTLLHSDRTVIVRTSKTPGHTKLINFFEVGKAFMLVDMPGYGFRQPENFEHSAEGYLKTSEKLRMTFLLVDSHVGLQLVDYVAIDMLTGFGVPFTFILTKADKASKRSLHGTLVGLKQAMEERATTCLPQPFLVSAIKWTGIPYLKSFIAHITGNLDR